jgi:hypothetical protein
VREREGACTRREAKGGEGRGAAALVSSEEERRRREDADRRGEKGESGEGGGASGVGGGGWVIKIIMKVDLVAE